MDSSPDLIERAQAGDETAFRELVDAHRHKLHLHCYRMLGSYGYRRPHDRTVEREFTTGASTPLRRANYSSSRLTAVGAITLNDLH
jgi:hypothetical protein